MDHLICSSISNKDLTKDDYLKIIQTKHFIKLMSGNAPPHLTILLRI